MLSAQSPNLAVSCGVGTEQGTRLWTLSRGDFYAGLFLVACGNGLASHVIYSVTHDGWGDALLSTFGTSVIVWIACYVGISFTIRDRSDSVRRSDLVVGIPFLATVALPVGGLGWFGVTALALYIIFCTNRSSTRQRGAIILLATAVSMLWSRLLFAFLCKPILDIDAALTAWLKGTPRVGNMVRFADNSGYLVILPGCSSFGNVSLAFLTWVLVSQSVGHRWSARDIFWCFLACASVILVNVSRLSLMATDMTQFATIHNQWGSAVANVIILTLIVSISALSVRRELLSRV
jgi:hypothetical protein